MSVDASDNTTTFQGSSTKAPPAASKLPHDNPSCPEAFVGESGARKRLRELDPENNDIDPGVAKRRRREKVPVQRSRLSDSPLHTSSLPLNQEARAESSLLSRPAEDKATPAIGPNDYTGALSGSGESDREGERESEGSGVHAPARSSSSPDKGEMKLSVVLRKYALLCIVYVTNSSVIRSDLQPQLLSELPRSCPPHTIALPEPLLPKLQDSCPNL